MIERYATVTAWANWFEKHEGVRISDVTIRNHLRDILTKPEDGRGRLNHLCTYFSETDVRKACADLLGPNLPYCDEGGFADISGVCHGTVGFLARHLEVSKQTVTRRITSSGIIPIHGRDGQGKLANLYPEPAVRELCADLMNPILMQIDEGCFSVNEGVRNGTVCALAHFFGVSAKAISSRLESSSLTPIRGKTKSGQLIDLWSEPAVRELCADFLDHNLPRCDAHGCVDIAGTRHGTIPYFAHFLGISGAVVSSRLISSEILSVRGKMRGGQIHNLYPEPAVRELFADLLDPGLVQVGENGFVDSHGIRFGTALAWSRELGISNKTIHVRLSEIKPVRGKSSIGSLVGIYPEPAVRELCAAFLDPSLPVCGEDGFVHIGGVRHGTIGSLARLFGISRSAMYPRLESSDIAPIRGKDKKGHPVDLYSELRIRELYSAILDPALSQVDGNGFVEIAGTRHGTISSIARILGISIPAISPRLANSGIAPLRGKSTNGHLADLYPEPAIRKLCADLLGPDLPRCDRDGFADIRGIRYGTVKTFANFLGIDKSVVSSRLKSSNIIFVRGKTPDGHVRNLYPEPAVRELCAAFLDPSLPVCGEDGFIDIGGVRHRTVYSLSCLLGISSRAIFTRLVSSGIPTVRGKMRGGQIRNLYPEPAVRQACVDLLVETPQAGTDGFAEINGIRHATLDALAGLFGISYNSIKSCVSSVRIEPVKGKSLPGNLADLYPEPAVRKLCRDLIEKRAKKNNPESK